MSNQDEPIVSPDVIEDAPETTNMPISEDTPAVADETSTVESETPAAE